MLDKDNVIDISWEEVEFAIDLIINKIISSNVIIDCIYGIPRGGVVPANLISTKLGVPYTLAIDRLVNEKYEHILVIDDISCSGKTLGELRWKHDLTTASLFLRATSSHIPDYYGVRLEHNNYITFPWERENGYK